MRVFSDIKAPSPIPDRLERLRTKSDPCWSLWGPKRLKYVPGWSVKLESGYFADIWSSVTCLGHVSVFCRWIEDVLGLQQHLWWLLPLQLWTTTVFTSTAGSSDSRRCFSFTVVEKLFTKKVKSTWSLISAQSVPTGPFWWTILTMVLVYLPHLLPQRNPCDWGSTYWRAAGVLQYWPSLTVSSLMRILDHGWFLSWRWNINSSSGSSRMPCKAHTCATVSE